MPNLTAKQLKKLLVSIDANKQSEPSKPPNTSSSSNEKGDIIPENETEIAFSEQQFRQLILAINNNRYWSFTRCNARFDGKINTTAVEEFLAAISQYKKLGNISDTDALREMCLLLEGSAALWWLGVKDTVNTFEEAKALIRSTFRSQKQDWELYGEIAQTKQQEMEPTFRFISKKRFLFSQLSPEDHLTESFQIDFIFGLIKDEIRDQLDRDSIKTFQDLITATRMVEDQLYSCSDCGLPGSYSPVCSSCKHMRSQPLDFNLLSSFKYVMPKVHMEIFGLKEEAMLDSGAKTSVAGAKLKKLLVQNNCNFTETETDITLADGSVTRTKILSTSCDAVIGNRTHNLKFICLSDAKENNTLLGMDFLESAGIVLDMGQQYWYFCDEPEVKFDFSIS